MYGFFERITLQIDVKVSFLTLCIVCFASSTVLLGICGYSWMFLCHHSENVLGLVNSEGLHDPGPVRWPLALCLLAAWIIIFLCMLKGIRSSGKVKWKTVVLVKLKSVQLPARSYNIWAVCVFRWFMLQRPSHTLSSSCWSSEEPHWRALYRALLSTSLQTGPV